MSSGSWGKPKEQKREFYEKAYLRHSLAEWDTRWHLLSIPARRLFLEEVKGPYKEENRSTYYQHTPRVQPSVPADRFPPEVLKELVEAGFVEVRPGPKPGDSERVSAPGDLFDFATRLRALHRHHLLAPNQSGELGKYVAYVYYNAGLYRMLAEVLRAGGIDDPSTIEDLVNHYVNYHLWLAWALDDQKDRMAGQVLAAVVDANGSLPLADLSARTSGATPEQVRAAADGLVIRLALVEDLHPETLDILIGLLPDVIDDLIRVTQPRHRPPLREIASPREFGPEGSVLIEDLRAFLLEVASEPPRLRQDHAFFQKEVSRFQELLAPLPAWFLIALKWSDATRLNQSYLWAQQLDLVSKTIEGKVITLHVAPKGRKWLASGLEEQYLIFCEYYRALPARNAMYYTPSFSDFNSSYFDFNVRHSLTDSRFVGVEVTAFKVNEDNHIDDHCYEIMPEENLALREALDRAFSTLPAQKLYRLDSVVHHLGFEEHNPVNLGLPPARVIVLNRGRKVPPLVERREEVGMELIYGFILRRLVPLGCVRTAIDETGEIGIARTPRLDAYFGREVGADELAGAPEGQSKVIVQPDFSIMIIGLNPAPAADLAPFCERASRGGTQGAMVLKLTRDAVVKAVGHGLKPAEIVARLKKHASNEIPANVLREVQDWCAWVRQVSLSTLTVLRCPDREAADRVIETCKGQAERITETIVALDRRALSSADRARLQASGILVQRGLSDPTETPAARTPKRRNRRW